MKLGCESITDDNLKSLTELGVAKAGDLKSNDFTGMTNLNRLRIDDGLFTTLPENIFDGLSQLEALSIIDGALMDLPENIFSNLENLKELYLFGNKLRSIPNLNPLKNLALLDVRRNLIESITADDLQGSSNLESLSLGNNPIFEYSEDTFENLPLLRELGISFFEAPSENIFEKLTSLKEIGISSDVDIELPENIFDGLNGLDTVWLTGLSLKTFPVSTATSLFLYKCKDIPNALLDYAPKIVMLSIDEPIDMNIDTLGSSETLEHVHIYNSTMQFVSDSFFSGLQAMKSITIEYGDLKGVSENAFSELKFLTYLTLGGRELANLPVKLFKTNSQLTDVRLTGKFSSQDQQAFTGLYPNVKFSFYEPNED